MENIAFAYLFIGWLFSSIGMIRRAETSPLDIRKKTRITYFFALGSNLLAVYILWKQ